MYSEADWDTIREKTRNFVTSLLDNFSSCDVSDNYVKLKNHIDQVIEAHIPSKQVTIRFNVPWISTNIKRMCRKKQRLYNRDKRTRKSRHSEKFRTHKKDTLRALRGARWAHINNILELSLSQNIS